MPSFKIAHIHEQGQDMIIVPLSADFGYKSPGEQSEIVGELQRRAIGAHLRGKIVPVWESGNRMSFIAPKPWHPLFRSLSMDRIMMSINKELSW